jgi:hypothetical protein
MQLLQMLTFEPSLRILQYHIVRDPEMSLIMIAYQYSENPGFVREVVCGCSWRMGTGIHRYDDNKGIAAGRSLRSFHFHRRASNY